MRRWPLLLLTVLATLTAQAQTVSVSGRVTDLMTGEVLQGAGVFFKGTTIGTMTDRYGHYTLETSDTTARCLVCYLLGYNSQEREIECGRPVKENFELTIHADRLREARVKADNSKARKLLENIEANRERNNPEARPSYQCDVYSKIELDLANAKERLYGRKAMKQFEFVFDYIDTTAGPGRSRLPAMFSETMAHRCHTRQPDADVEEIVANRVSGINPEGNLLTQFTGTMHLKGDFYSPFINAFGVELPSPLQSGGLLYYNYFIVDSTAVDGRKTYVVHYRPKRGISSPAFDGEMLIDAGDWALRRIHARMKHGGNVNWLKDLTMDAEYGKQADSGWFYLQNDLCAELSVFTRDSSRTLSVVGTRKMTYMNPDFSPQESVNSRAGVVNVNPEANFRDEDYWDRYRPVALSPKEKGIYEMVERVKEQPLYNTLYTVVETCVNGYLDVGPVGFGNVLQFVSANNLEGFRAKFGMHTSSDLSKKRRATGYVAYGFGDKSFKGGLSYERMFSKTPTSKLTLDAHYDVVQLGKVGSPLIGENILMAIWHANLRLCPMSDFSALYEHEFSAGFNFSVSAAMKRWYGNEFVPMVTQDGVTWNSIAANELRMKARFSWDETVNRGHFIKKYVHTNYPVLTFDLAGSASGLREGDWAYLRPQMSVDWAFNLPPAGRSRLSVSGGTMLGQVPYPLLHIFSANGSFINNRQAFNCMDYMEFAADSWATLMWEHNFHGFFLGKIPLLNRLKLREQFGFKMGYGTVREENSSDSGIFVWPWYMDTMGKTPYMEVSAGLTNILKVLRVDCCWRLTHLETATQKFKVTLGLDLSF